MIEEQPITLEAIDARSLCRPNLSATDVVTVLGSDSRSPEHRRAKKVCDCVGHRRNRATVG